MADRGLGVAQQSLSRYRELGTPPVRRCTANAALQVSRGGGPFVPSARGRGLCVRRGLSCLQAVSRFCR